MAIKFNLQNLVDKYKEMFSKVTPIGQAVGAVKTLSSPQYQQQFKQQIIQPATSWIPRSIPEVKQRLSESMKLPDYRDPKELAEAKEFGINLAMSGSTAPVAKVRSLQSVRSSIEALRQEPQKIGQTLKGRQSLPKLDDLLGKKGQSPFEDIISDPIQKITSAIKEAKPLRAAQEAIYTKVRSQQAGALGGIGEQMAGEAGYFKKLGKLKGELPKVEFESIRNKVSQTDVDFLFNKVEQSNLPVFEKVNAQTGLAKLLGGEGMQVPTEGELELLSQVFPKDFIQAVLSNRTLFQKIMSGAEAALNIPRTIMATADLSAPLRQGIFLVGRPKQWIPAFKDMFRYAFSEKAYQGLMDDIKVRPTYPLMREGKLALTDTGSIPIKREEEFMSTLVEKIPIFGKITKGSNRAYSGFLNKLRADVFDDLVEKAGQQGIKVKGKTLNDLASFINAATGRGNLPKALQKSAPMLNGVFFSPRLVFSRVRLLNPIEYIKYDPFVRKEALKSLTTFGGTAMTILGLAKLAGAEVVANPTNADFGKIKVGNTRYDILGGFQQYIRLGAQLYTGKIQSSTTGKTITLGEGYKPLTRYDILRRFFEFKTAPIASFALALMSGKTSIGEDVSVPTEIINRFIPMVIQDIYDLAQDQDSTGKAIAMGLPAIFGAGVQTYGKSEFVTGENPIGQETSQIRPVPGMGEAITERLFGKQPLGSSKSFNIEAYLEDMEKMNPEAQKIVISNIRKTNKDLYDQLKQIAKDKKMGMTPEDYTLKDKGVKSGDRAQAILKELNKLTTPEEKKALWDDYKKKKIITKEVQEQLEILMSKEKSDRSFLNIVSEAQAAEDVSTGSTTLDTLLAYDSEEKSIIDAQYSLDVDRAKRSEDYTTWLEKTSEYIDYLTKYESSLDPEWDAAEKIRLQNKIEDLVAQVEKYQGYGGSFTKPKKPKKITLKKVSVPKVSVPKSKVKKVTVSKPKRYVKRAGITAPKIKIDKPKGTITTTKLKTWKVSVKTKASV